MTTLLYILYITIFHLMIHFVDNEFEFVDLPVEVSIQDMLLKVITLVGLVVICIIIGIIMIKSVLIGG